MIDATRNLTTIITNINFRLIEDCMRDGETAKEIGLPENEAGEQGLKLLTVSGNVNHNMVYINIFHILGIVLSIFTTLFCG